MFYDWKVCVRGPTNTTIRTPAPRASIVDDAGKRVGLGDFRPVCKGPFGKYVVVRWAEQQAQTPTRLAA